MRTADARCACDARHVELMEDAKSMGELMANAATRTQAVAECKQITTMGSVAS